VLRLKDRRLIQLHDRGVQALSDQARDALDARVLSAAAQVFASSGFRGASLQAIAELSGMSKQLLIYHFGPKPILWQAALRWSRARYQTRYAEAIAPHVCGDPVPRLAHAVSAVSEAYHHESRWNLMVLAIAGLDTPQREAARQDITLADYGYVAEHLPVWVARGESVDLPVDVFLHLIFGTLNSISTFRRLYREGDVEADASLARVQDIGARLVELVRPR
jgi:AcrR family transcriptional regulator